LIYLKKIPALGAGASNRVRLLFVDRAELARVPLHRRQSLMPCEFFHVVIL
jgi:hypothetical protein